MRFLEPSKNIMFLWNCPMMWKPKVLKQTSNFSLTLPSFCPSPDSCLNRLVLRGLVEGEEAVVDEEEEVHLEVVEVSEEEGELPEGVDLTEEEVDSEVVVVVAVVASDFALYIWMSLFVTRSLYFFLPVFRINIRI